MPLIPEQTDSVLPDLIREKIVDDDNMVVPEMSKVFGASFRLDNEVGAFFANKSRGNGTFDPNFDWGKSFRELPVGYQIDFGKNFALAENQDHFNAIKEDIDREMQDREYRASAGWLGVVADLSAGLASPMNLVPIGGAALKFGRGAKHVLENSAKIAMVGAGAITAQELALHSQEETRTLGESAANVSVGALLSGVVGAAMYSSLAKDAVKFEKLKVDLDKDFQLQPEELTPGEFGHSGGALFNRPENVDLPDGNLKTVFLRSLSEGQNYLTDLSDYSDKIFRQTEVGDALQYLPNSGVFGDTRFETFFSNKKELALGQGKNANGVILGFKTKGLQGKVNTQKPGWDKLFSEGSAEFIAKLNERKQYADNLISIEIPKKSQGRVADNTRLKNSIEGLKKQGWVEQDKGDSVLIFKPQDFGWSGGALFEKPKTPQPETTLQQEGLASAKGLEKVFRFQDPGLRLIQSESRNARIAIQNLAEISGKLNKNFEGIASPVAVESLRKIDEGRLAAAKVYGNDQYLAYRQRLDAAGAKDRMTHAEFMEAVTKANRRGGASEVPEVAKVAAYDRKNIYDYYKNEGMKIPGFFEDDDLAITTAPSYVNRMYNREKIVQNSPDFINRTVKWLKENDIRTQADNAKGARRLGDSLDFNTNEEYIRAAQDIQRNIIGAQSNVLHDKLGMSVQPKFTKSRKFLIKDEDIEDYFENNREILLTQYSKLMSSRIRTAQKFGLDFLSDNFNEAKSPIVKSIKDEYAKMRVEAGGDAKKAKALFKAEERDLNDVFAVRDRLLGTYGFTSNPDSWLYRFQKQLKQYNVLRMLGDVTTAAIPDIGKLVYVSGFTKLFSQGVAPLVSKLRSSEMRAYLAKNTQEIRNMGTALDLVTESRANAMNDIMDDFGRHTKAERAMDYLGSKFQKVTGIGYWNTAMKTVAATMVQTNMAEAITKLNAGRATAREIADLAASGIDKETAKTIQQQIKKHGEVVEGLTMPNLAAWDVEAIDAAERYAAAVTKATDSIIVTPGVATTPLWMSRQGINLMGQFKSFAFSSVQKTMIPMLQDFDGKAVQAMTVMVGLGTLTAVIKRTVSGQEIPDTSTLMTEGVDRSGILAWTMDANNIMEKVTGGNLGISKILGSQPMSRYAQRGRIESVLGPSAALLSDIMTISSDLAGGDPRKSTVHRVRKMIPFQTLMGVRQTLDILEDEVNNSLGITQK